MMSRLRVLVAGLIGAGLSVHCGTPANFCDVSVCPSGCCDSNGVCQGGLTSQACGASGLSCQVCGATETCAAQACVPASAYVDAGPTVSSIGADAGLPCEVANLLNARCVLCHSSPPTQSATVPMVSQLDLLAFAPGYPGVTVAQRSVIRMKDTAARMPPLPHDPATPAEIYAFEQYVNAGLPSGSCADPIVAPDGGTGPYPTTCAANRFWTSGNAGSSRMNPGYACVSCHKGQNFQNQNPGHVSQPFRAYYFMGTAFPGLNEKDLCSDAPPSGAVVEIIDASGRVALTLPINSVGNFYSTSTSAGVSLPYTAKVKANGRERLMSTPQTSGDCNTCHTEQGLNSAPGRVLLP